MIRRRPLRFAAVLGALTALLGTACSLPFDGRPAPAVEPPPSAADALGQAVVDLGEAAAVRYRAGLATASGDPVTLDVVVTGTGEVTGRMTVHGRQAAVLAVGGGLYLKAGTDFWTAMAGVPDSTAPAVADRWAKVPGSVLGMDPGELLTPSALGAGLGVPRADSPPPAQQAREQVNGIDTVRIDTDAGSVHVAAAPPRGIVRLTLRQAGRTDLTRVRDLSVDVTEASTDLAAVYRELAGQGAQLAEALDPFGHLEQGGHRFVDCGPARCGIVVEFGNPAPRPVRVAVRATWTGDGRGLGSCDTVTGPVAKGQHASATCTLASPEWTAFYRRVHAVGGGHSYQADWSVTPLAEAPDLGGLAALRAAASAPVDAATRHQEGSHHVYALHDVNGDINRGVWKYGVAAGPGWRDAVSAQIPRCAAATRSICVLDEVSAADGPARAHLLEQALIRSYRFRNGTCPPGQWVACPR